MKQTSRQKRAEDSAFGDKLLRSAQQARDWVQGKPVRVRVTYAPAPQVDVRKLRARMGLSQTVPVQREMERERSPLVSNTRPSGGGFSRHLGLPIRCVLGRARKTNFRAHEHRLDEPTRVSLSMVASLQSPLPF